MAGHLIAPAGLEVIAIAKQNGNWDALEEVDNVIVPADLQLAFNQNNTAFENWNNFSRSSRRGMLEWILNAKRAETRIKRIETTVQLAADNIKANH